MRKLCIIVFTLLFLASNVSESQVTSHDICDNFVNVVIDGMADVKIMDIHPQRNIIAVAGFDGLAVYRLPDFEYIGSFPIELETDQTFVQVIAIAWSTNGDYVAGAIVYTNAPNQYGESIAQVHIDIWTFDDFSRTTTLHENGEEPINGLGSMAWSSDDKYLATVVSRSGSLNIWDIHQRELIYVHEASGRSIGDTNIVSWFTNANVLAFVDGDGSTISSSKATDIYLIEVNPDTRVIQTLETDFAQIYAIENLPQDKIVLAGGGTLQIWDSGRFQMVHEITNAQNRADTLRWSDESQLLAVGGHINAENGIITYNLPYNEVMTYTGQPYLVSQIDWSPDGQYIYAFGSNGDSITGFYNTNIFVWDSHNKCLFREINAVASR